jgi:hypothetical protein
MFMRSTLALRAAAVCVLLASLIAPAAPLSAAPAAAVAEQDGGVPTGVCAPPAAGEVTCLAEEVVVGPARLLQPGDGYGPADLKQAYAIPDSTTTATVAIVSAFAPASVETDLATYRSQYDLPACTVGNGCLTLLNEDGRRAPMPTARDTGWAKETALDVQMVSAVCPTCRILVAFAQTNTTDHLDRALRSAVAAGARYVSMSWGAPEDDPDFFPDQHFAVGDPGVAFVAASGDWGYAAGVSWPSSAPGVVSVGGTSLRRDPSSARGFSESVWGNAPDSGTGSGCSRFYAKPAWQSTSLCGKFRAVNDVAVVGDPQTGVSVYHGGLWRVMGGTSAGAPIVAAMYALAGAPSKFVPPAPSYPYTRRGEFLDITSGSNGSCGTAVCNGAVGWDGPTGVGVPQGVKGFRAPVFFRDYTRSSTFGAQVYRLADEGIIGGWPDGTFRASQPVSRQAFASFLAGTVNAHRPGSVGSGPCAAAKPSGFADVPSDSQFCRQIRDLAATGVIGGYGDGTFKPTAPISRQAMAALVRRADAHTAGLPAPVASECGRPFTDVGPADAFCADIAWMKDSGISTGNRDGTYRPAGRSSREATAAFLARLLERWQAS